ncbi:MAG TPA: hypothetical protein VMU50_09830 [Polyangia bacterium]|nr:hypothetical protein [Polyangia bacterium]
MPADAPSSRDEQKAAALGAGELGFVLGAALLQAPPAVAERLLDGAGPRCRSALEALGALPGDGRAIRLAALQAQALDPVPAGIGTVHPHWLRPALLAESSATLRAVIAGLPAPVVELAETIIAARGDDATPGERRAPDEQAVREIRRAIFAEFAAADRGTPDPAKLLDDLGRRGAEIIGASLRGAPRPAIARAAAQLAEPAATILIGAAARGGPPGERLAARQRVASVPLGDDRIDAALKVGLHEMADALAGQPEEAALAIAQRLPLMLGRLLLELTAARGRRAPAVVQIAPGAR